MRLRRLALAALIAVLWQGADRLSGQAVPGPRVGAQVFSELEAIPSDTLTTAQFNITRAYLIGAATLRPGLTGRVTLDVTRENGGSLTYRLKHAYFQWEPAAPVDLRFGMIPTAWVEWQDALWGYRMQGAQLIDRAGFITSADLGASAGFNTADQRVEGVIDVVNGEGFGYAPDGRYLDAEARASVRLLAAPGDSGRTGGLRLAAFAHVGRFANGLARQRYTYQISYKQRGRVALGASYGFVVNDDADVDNADVRLWSGFGAVNLGATPLALVGRLDRLETVDHALGDVFTRGFAGLACRLGPGVRVLGDVERTAYLADHSVAPGAPRTRLLFQTELVF